MRLAFSKRNADREQGRCFASGERPATSILTGFLEGGALFVQGNDFAPSRPVAHWVESRSSARVATDLPIVIRSADFTGSLMAQTRDLSASGACVATAAPLCFKNIYEVTLNLPNRLPALKARGCWQRENHSEDLVLTGIAFEELDPRTARIIWDYVFDKARDLTHFLHDQSPLGTLGMDDCMALACVSRFRSSSTGQTIYRQGDGDEANGSMFIVDRGEVTLHLKLADDRAAPFMTLKEGDVFGGLPALAGLPQTETAVASTPLRLIEIDASGFECLRMRNPRLAERLAGVLVRTHIERTGQTLARAAECL